MHFALWQKAHFLQKNFPTSVRDDLQALIHQILGEAVLAEAFREALSINLIYALVRHLPWIQTPFFREAVTNYLNRDHLLAREIAESLVNSATSCFPPAAEVRSNEEFLRYLVVHAATAKDEPRFVVDFGLGPFLAEKIRSASATSADSYCFLPEIEECLQETMAKLGDQMRVTPWIMEVERLRFRLAQFEPLASVRPEDLTRIFQLLVRIGKAPLEVNGKEDADFKSDLERLTRADCLYLETSRKKLARLTRFSQEITANAYALQLARRKNHDWRNFQKLCEDYQIAICATMADHEELWQILLSHWQTMAPQAFDLGLKRVGARSERAQTFLQAILPAAETGRLKRTIEKILSETLPPAP